MSRVIIDGVEYVPSAEISALTDERLQSCLEVLTEMRYFNQHHKMKSLAWNAINALAPELAKLSEEEAYDLIHGTGVNTMAEEATEWRGDKSRSTDLLVRIREWLSLPETKEKLKVVAEESIEAGKRLDKARHVSRETMNRPFDI